MSVSFQSGSAGSAGTVSQESSPQQLVVKTGTVHTHGLPNPRPRKLSAVNKLVAGLELLPADHKILSWAP